MLSLNRIIKQYFYFECATACDVWRIYPQYANITKTNITTDITQSGWYTCVFYNRSILNIV